MNRKLLIPLLTALVIAFSTGCATTSLDPDQLLSPGKSIEELTADPYFEEVFPVTPGPGYESRLLAAPALFFSKQTCVFSGGFRGSGDMWYLTSATDQWKPVKQEIEWPKGSTIPVSNAEPLENWWAVAAIPDGKAIFIYQCGDGDVGAEQPVEEVHVSTEENLAPTPELPRRWYPFGEWLGDEDYSAYENEDDLDLVGPLPAGCPTQVHSFNLFLSGQVRGSLSFNQHKRGGPRWANSMNGGNTTLGGFQNYQTRFNSWLGYKYQVEIRFLGPLQHAFYGQMIADPQAFSFSDPEFHDDPPANDWPTKRWNLGPGESKSSFPVIELVTLTNTDHIVRYIDSPGGGEVMGIGRSDKYVYVIIYAGACGVVTHIKYLQLYYPDQFRWTDGTPRATEMTLQEFRDAVGDWSFAD